MVKVLRGVGVVVVAVLGLVLSLAGAAEVTLYANCVDGSGATCGDTAACTPDVSVPEACTLARAIAYCDANVTDAGDTCKVVAWSNGSERVEHTVSAESMLENMAGTFMLQAGSMANVVAVASSTTSFLRAVPSSMVLFAMENLTVRGFTATSGDGGAIHVDGADTVDLQNCAFRDNAALSGNGGSINVENADVVNVNACEFSGNRAADDGGALQVLSSTAVNVSSWTVFRNNSVSSGIGGGAKIAIAEVAEVNDGRFYNNSAVGSNGGGLLIMFADRVAVRRCTFMGNAAAGLGGGFLLWRSANTEIVRPEALNNSATQGGGVYVYASENTFVYSPRFYQNSAEDGAGLFVGQSSFNAMVVDGRFWTNTATTAGGGMAVDQSTWVRILNSTFSTNSAANGAGLLLQLGVAQANVSNCLFSDNVVSDNGGGASVLVQNEDITFSDCVWVNNRAYVSGGALSLEMGNVRVNLTRNVYRNNVVVDGHGGAIILLLDNERVKVSDSLFSGNELVGMVTDGSAIGLILHNGYVTVSNCLFENGVGSAVSAAFFNYVTTVVDSQFVNMSTTGSGAAMFMDTSNSALTIQRCTFRECRSSGPDGGGALFLGANPSWVMDSNFTRNRAIETGGGAIVASGTDIEAIYLWNITCTNNRAGPQYWMDIAESWLDDDGAVNGDDNDNDNDGDDATSGTDDDDDAAATLADEETAVHGGCVYVSSVDSITIQRSTLESNTAVRNGGGVSVAWVNTFALQNSSLRHNVAAMGSGGGLYMDTVASDADLLFTTFQGNAAANGGGGGVFWEADSMDDPVWESSEFSMDNTAHFGPRWATSPDRLQCTPNWVKAASGQPAPDVNASVVDAFGQVVSIAPVASVAVSSASAAGTVSGTTSAPLVDGIAEFDQLSLVQEPGTAMGLDFSVFLSGQVLECRVNVTMRLCEPGEELNGDLCRVCPPGTYSWRVPDGCRRCPKHVECAGRQSFVVDSGFWRTSNTSAKIYECEIEDGCAGGSGHSNQLCKDGYKGALCAVCANSYFFSATDGMCVSCGNGETSVVFIVLLIALTLLLVWIVARLIIACFKKMGQELMAEASASEAHHARLFQSMRTKLRILLVYFQIVGGFPEMLSLNSYPPAFTGFLGVLDVTNLDLPRILPTNCLFHTDFFTELQFITLAPLALMASLIVWYLGRDHYLTSRGQPGASAANCVQLCLLVAYIVFPMASTKVFEAFLCQEFDDGSNFLRADRSIECSGSYYESIVIYASFFVLVYPVGIPLVFARILFSRKDFINMFEDDEARSIRVRQDDHTLNPFRFLFETYRPNVWWWEVLDTLRRLSLSSLLVFFAEGSVLQIIIGVLIAAIFLKLYIHFSPFVRKDDSILAEVVAWETLTTLFASLLLRMNYGEGSVTMDVILVSVNLLSVVLVLAMLGIEYYQMRYLTQDAASAVQDATGVDLEKKIQDKLQQAGTVDAGAGKGDLELEPMDHATDAEHMAVHGDGESGKRLGQWRRATLNPLYGGDGEQQPQQPQPQQP